MQIKILNITLCFLLFLLLGINDAYSQKTKDVAFILKSNGKVKIKKDKAKNWDNSKRGLRLDSGDIIKTYDNSIAAVLFTDDKSLLKIRDNSVVAIKGKREKKSMTKRIICSFGNFWVKVSKQKSKLLVETPSGVAAVKGTEFYGIVDKDGNTMIIAIEGIVQLLNKFGDEFVKAGQSGTMSKDSAPKVFKSDPNKKMDWAGGDDNKKELKFEFQDSDGNIKNLKILYH